MKNQIIIILTILLEIAIWNLIPTWEIPTLWNILFLLIAIFGSIYLITQIKD